MDYMDNPINCVCAKHVRTSTNKNKCPIYSVCVSAKIFIVKIIQFWFEVDTRREKIDYWEFDWRVHSLEWTNV